MIERIAAFFVFLPVAISLIVLSLTIRKQYLYGTDHDVFRRDLFSRKKLPPFSDERDTDK